MSLLGNSNMPQENGLSPEMMQNIQQVKGMMNMMSGDPAAMLKQNPMLNQAMQMCNGQNPKDFFMSMCKARGIDPNVILNELRKPN